MEKDVGYGRKKPDKHQRIYPTGLGESSSSAAFPFLVLLGDLSDDNNWKPPHPSAYCD